MSIQHELRRIALLIEEDTLASHARHSTSFMMNEAADKIDAKDKLIAKYEEALTEIARRENCTDECYCSSCIARNALKGDTQ